jgi:outer membrane receptor protein involved in Fe transport
LILGSYVNDSFETHLPGGGVIFLATDAGDPAFVLPTDLTRDYSRDFKTYSVEAQHIQSFSWNTLIVGARFQHIDEDVINNDSAQTYNLSGGSLNGYFPVVPFSFPEERFSANASRVSLYAQDYWKIADSLQLFGGVTAEFLNLPSNDSEPPLTSQNVDRSRVLPLGGIQWKPRSEVDLQASYSQAVTGQSFDQSLRLEPTHFVGLPLTYQGAMPESLVGSVSGQLLEIWQAQTRLKVFSDTYVLLTARQIQSSAHRQLGALVVDFGVDPVTTSAGQALDFRERSVEASVWQLLGQNFGFGARYQAAHDTLDQNLNGIDAAFFANPFSQFSARQEGLLHTVSIDALAHNSYGFFLQANATWRLQNDLFDTNLGGDLPQEDFWQFNVFAGYRTPKRHFEGQIGLLNITDQDYRLHPINVWQTIPRGRTLALTARINF